jgi:hypothetical protein
MGGKTKEDISKFIGAPVPDILYHYTNLDGLLGIINNEELWFSDMYFLNDKSEYELGLNIVIEELEAKKEGFKILKSTRIFIDALEQAINFIKDRDSPYILSLTTNKDLLSQWRAYTDNGIGVNIGLSKDFFKEAKLQVYKCIYEPKIQREFIRFIIMDAIFMFVGAYSSMGLDKRKEEELTEDDLSEAISIAGRHFIDRTILACSLIKDISFIEEQEWRALFINRTEKIHFLSKKNFYKPFVKIKIENLDKSIKSVTAGPNPERELCHLSLQKLLKSKSLMRTYIDFSTIPYRN